MIDYYRVSATGGQEKFFTVELRDAVITSFTSSGPHAVLRNSRETEESVAISYRDIIWTHRIANTSGWDSWEGNR